MNAERRKKLRVLIGRAQTVRNALAPFDIKDDLKDEVEAVKSEEEEYAENLPDGSDKHGDAEERIEKLQEAEDLLDALADKWSDIDEDLDGIISLLEEATV